MSMDWVELGYVIVMFIGVFWLFATAIHLFHWLINKLEHWWTHRNDEFNDLMDRMNEVLAKFESEFK